MFNIKERPYKIAAASVIIIIQRAANRHWNDFSLLDSFKVRDLLRIPAELYGSLGKLLFEGPAKILYIVEP